MELALALAVGIAIGYCLQLPRIQDLKKQLERGSVVKPRRVHQWDPQGLMDPITPAEQRKYRDEEVKNG
jgi:hypothetical protein